MLSSSRGRARRARHRFRSPCIALTLGFVAGGTLAVPAAGQAARAGADPQAAAAAPAEMYGFADPLPENPPKPAPELPSRQFGLRGAAAPSFVLDPLSDDYWAMIEAEDAEREQIDKVLRYGVRREVGLDVTTGGEWIEVVDVGLIWTADLVVPGAMGIRVQFTDFDLAPGAQVWVYATDESRILGPYEGRGLVGSGEFWTPTIYSDTVRIEYFVPFDSAGGLLDGPGYGEALPEELFAPAFDIPACQHVYRDPVATDLRVGSCHNDVSCYSAWANTAKASAGIGTVNSNALYCSGTMIATTNADQTPYWLTANHCISSASQAQSAEIYWRYQTPSCGGTPPSLASVPQSAPCTRLSYSSTSDYSLLMVEGTIPSGLYWSGWSSATVANGTNVTCIHHPDGSWKRISFATKTSGAAANFIRADWYDAPTEPGSSGSGLFRDDTKQLVGQLYGGPSSCSSESYDDYGAFATTYNSISSYLSAGSDDAYENNDTCATARSMTAGTYSNLVVKRYSGGDEDWFSVSVGAGQTLTVSLSFTHASGDVELELYSACGGSLLASSTGNTNSESVSWTNSGGSAVTRYVRVYLYDDTRATYSMTISTGGGGGGGNNDNCANATVVTNGTYTGSTANATRDGSARCGSSSSTRDVWYRYTAPATGTLSVNSCGSGYDTVVSLHSGCPGTTSNQLRCNDDCGGSPCGGVASCFSRSVTAGVTYYIRVSGYNGAYGSFTLNISGP